MRDWLAGTWAVFAKDVRLELRARVALSTLVLFVLGALVSCAQSPPQRLDALAAQWIAAETTWPSQDQMRARYARVLSYLHGDCSERALEKPPRCPHFATVRVARRPLSMAYSEVYDMARTHVAHQWGTTVYGSSPYNLTIEGDTPYMRVDSVTASIRHSTEALHHLNKVADRAIDSLRAWHATHTAHFERETSLALRTLVDAPEGEHIALFDVPTGRMITVTVTEYPPLRLRGFSDAERIRDESLTWTHLREHPDEAIGFFLAADVYLFGFDEDNQITDVTHTNWWHKYGF